MEARGRSYGVAGMKILFLDDMQQRHDTFRRNHIGSDVLHAYTAEEANRSLDNQVWDVASLDHDLCEEHYLTMSEGQSEDVIPGHKAYSPGTGMDVVDHIVAMPPEKRPRAVIVHSMNVVRSQEMVARLRDAGIRTAWMKFSPSLVYR